MIYFLNQNKKLLKVEIPKGVKAMIIVSAGTKTFDVIAKLLLFVGANPEAITSTNLVDENKETTKFNIEQEDLESVKQMLDLEKQSIQINYLIGEDDNYNMEIEKKMINFVKANNLTIIEHNNNLE